MDIYLVRNTYGWDGAEMWGRTVGDVAHGPVGVFFTPELAADACIAMRMKFVFSGDWSYPEIRPEWKDWFDDKYHNVYIEKWNIMGS